MPQMLIHLGGSKAEDAPPHIPHVLPPPVVAVCIDQREHFTTKHKFATHNDLLERKLGSLVFPLLLVNLITVAMEEAHLLL